MLDLEYISKCRSLRAEAHRLGFLKTAAALEEIINGSLCIKLTQSGASEKPLDKQEKVQVHL